ncbi:MAG: hypothetical protein IJI06_08985 [Oscillospiraceae bacterium]|nr:hypothetical protein [Oscillospiraceae bacterium]
MSENKTKYIGIFALGLALVGNVIGVSFSTGREIMTYFGNFGIAGYIGIAIAFGALALSAYMSFCTSRNMDRYTFDWLVSPRGWKPWRIFSEWLTLIGLLSSISAMIAATGSILQALFGVPYLVGALFMVAACAATAILPMKKFADTLGFMVPVMVVLAIAICVICAISPVVSDSDFSSVSSSNKLIGNWFLASLIYVGYNIGPVRAMIAPMAKEIKNKKNAAVSAVIMFVILGAVAACAMTAIVRNYSICSEEALPTVTMAYYKNSVAGILYGVVAIVAIYSTCATFVQIFKYSFAKFKPLAESKTKLNLSMLLLTLVAFGLSFIGFSNIVDRVWAVLGYTGFLGIAFAIYNFFYYRKHPQNRETAVDNVELAPEVK